MSRELVTASKKMWQGLAGKGVFAFASHCVVQGLGQGLGATCGKKGDCGDAGTEFIIDVEGIVYIVLASI
jgi:hypothetical protein